MTSNKAVKSIALFYRDARSDKEYHVSIDPVEGGYLVNIAYGRRGSALRSMPKTKTPVALEQAEKLYDKIVAGQLAEGYTPTPGAAVPFTGTEKAGRVSGLAPQLLNAVDESEVERLILDDRYVAQPKWDGERRMVRGTEGVNRKGLFKPMPVPLVEAIQCCVPAGSEIDGEEVGDTLHVFDVLSLHGKDVRDLPYRARLNLMSEYIASEGKVQLVESAIGAPAKRALLARLRSANAEGIVFKDLDAPYAPGRPNSGGPQLKFKFVATASVKVAAQNDEKRSVRMCILKAGVWTEVGNVTIPPNHSVPPVGAIIEVQYLYAYPDGGCLFQPIYLGERSDIEESECVETQLKYKAEVAA